MKNKKKHEKIENQMQKKKSPSILAIVIKFNRYNLLFRIQNLQIVCVFFKSSYILLRTRNPPKTLVKCQE